MSQKSSIKVAFPGDPLYASTVLYQLKSCLKKTKGRSGPFIGKPKKSTLKKLFG